MVGGKASGGGRGTLKSFVCGGRAIGGLGGAFGGGGSAAISG